MPVTFHLAWIHQSFCPAYPWTIRRACTLFVIVPYFMEIVLVELTDKTGEVAVLEMLRKNGFRELLILSSSSALRPVTGLERLGDIPPRPRNYRAHHPILRLMHKMDPPTFYDDSQCRLLLNGITSCVAAAFVEHTCTIFAPKRQR